MMNTFAYLFCLSAFAFASYQVQAPPRLAEQGVSRGSVRLARAKLKHEVASIRSYEMSLSHFMRKSKTLYWIMLSVCMQSLFISME